MEDEFDDFDFEGYMEKSNKEWDAKLEMWRERMITEAINANYENIAKNGISDWHARHLNIDELKALNETLHFMTDHFIDLEEYEKCAVLKKEIKKVDEVLEKTRQ